MMRRAFLAGLFLVLAEIGGGLTLTATPARADAHVDKARAFIESLSGEALKSLTAQDITRPARIDLFRKLFREHFAVDAIGQWVLGRYWKKASQAEQDEYLALFEDLIVASYVDRFANYAGEKLAIQKAIAQGEQTAIIYSEIVQPGIADPVRVDWRVDDGGSRGFKVTDLLVQGTSMSQTLRSDFASTIRANGGTVAGLLVVLREKTASIKAAAGN